MYVLFSLSINTCSDSTSGAGGTVFWFFLGSLIDLLVQLSKLEAKMPRNDASGKQTADLYTLNDYAGDFAGLGEVTGL